MIIIIINYYYKLVITVPVSADMQSILYPSNFLPRLSIQMTVWLNNWSWMGWLWWQG